MIYRQRGRIVGLEADFAAAIGEAIGSDVQFVELPWEEQIPALERGDIDIVMSAMTITEMRRVLVRFSRPYMAGGLTALVPRAIAEKGTGPLRFLISEQSVAVQRGTTGHEFCRDQLANAHVLTYDTVDEALQAVLAGEADAMVHDAPVVWNLAARHADSGLAPLPSNLTTEYYAWAMDRQNADLAEAVDRAMVGWQRDGTLLRMVHKWIPLAR
jgi:ABC-type amino acid transport substrate-binding protein